MNQNYLNPIITNHVPTNLVQGSYSLLHPLTENEVRAAKRLLLKIGYYGKEKPVEMKENLYRLEVSKSAIPEPLDIEERFATSSINRSPRKSSLKEILAIKSKH